MLIRYPSGTVHFADAQPFLGPLALALQLGPLVVELRVELRALCPKGLLRKISKMRNIYL